MTSVETLWTMSRIVFLVLGLMMVVAEEEVQEGGKCERIRLPMCQDLRYNWTAMPNLLGHKDQKEAEEAMSVFSAMVSSGCSAHARFLVCSAFAPLCSEEVSGLVSACRAVCESVAEACAAHLPAGRLDCGAFPARPDRTLCMRPPHAAEPEPPAPPRWPAAPDACPPGLARAPPGGCVPACGADVLHSGAEKRAAEASLAALAWVALLATSLALLTFCAEPGRYRYPERPAVWMAACHGAAALAHAARGSLGSRAVSCSGGALAVDGLESPACVAFFSVAHYFSLAADAWFANACVSWYLTAASEWSTEALERGAAYLHAVAWGWAGAWTAAALALRRVAADELTGTCGIAAGASGALEGVPRGALLVAGAALAVGAAPGVARVRRALDAAGARRVGRVALRAAAGGALYFLLSGGAVCARVAGHSATGAALGLAAGTAAAVWAVSRKSCAVWARALCPPRKPPPHPLLPPQPTPYYKRPLHVSRV